MPKGWLEKHDVSTKHPGRPLNEVGLYLWGRVRPGGDGVTLAIPTLRDGVREGVEAVAVRIYRDGHDAIKRTIRVVD